MKKILAAVLLLFPIAFLANAQTGNWSGKLDVRGTPLTIVFHLDGDEPTLDSPDQAALGIPVQIERTALGGITIKIPSLGASYEGLWAGKQILGTFKQAGLSLPLALTPEKELNRPQTPVGPFPYSEEEITFTNGEAKLAGTLNGEAKLAGTLVLPEGYTRKTPVLIMVTGSGQEDRNEEIFEHKPFAVIADALARAGIATLRCDDRGVGGSTGEVITATTEDFKDDALAGIKLLRERFDKVGVIGHSEGGTIALMLAAEGQADFIISLAGVAVSGIELLVAQSRTALEAAGYPEEQIETVCKAIGEAAYVRVHGGRMPFPDELDVPDALKQVYQSVMIQIQTPWMRKLLSLDMRPKLGGITCPVLALNGTKDIQVDYQPRRAARRSSRLSQEQDRSHRRCQPPLPALHHRRRRGIPQHRRNFRSRGPGNDGPVDGSV